MIYERGWTIFWQQDLVYVNLQKIYLIYHNIILNFNNIDLGTKSPCMRLRPSSSSSSSSLKSDRNQVDATNKDKAYVNDKDKPQHAEAAERHWVLVQLY